MPRSLLYFGINTQMCAAEKINQKISKIVLIDTLKNGHFSLFIMRKLLKA